MGAVHPSWPRWFVGLVEPSDDAANVFVPKDKVTTAHQGFGFVEFKSEEDADYAIRILSAVKLYGRPLRVNKVPPPPRLHVTPKASQDKKSADVGANLFIGNLDPDVDETLLHNVFSAFGVIVGNTPKVLLPPPPPPQPPPR